MTHEDFIEHGDKLNIRPEEKRYIMARFWEQRAKDLYGYKYKEPKEGEELSKQARDLCRKHYEKKGLKNPFEKETNKK